jgi:hypothetical protein
MTAITLLVKHANYWYVLNIMEIAQLLCFIFGKFVIGILLVYGLVRQTLFGILFGYHNFVTWSMRYCTMSSRQKHIEINLSK